MADLSLRLDLRQVQKLLMTPSLQQAIKLLQLSRLDMVQLIRQELTENPILEEVPVEEERSEEKKESEDNYKEEKENASESSESKDRSSEMDWEEYFNDSSSLGLPTLRDNDAEAPSWENTLVKLPSLQDHLMWQLRFVSIPEEEELIGEAIIGNIDDHGYLQATIEEITEMTESQPAQVEKVLSMIQGFEPLGVGARDLQECLSLQVKGKGEDIELQTRIINEHLTDLEYKKYPAIASALKIPLKKVIELAAMITSYDPRPGRNYSVGDVRYVVPDVLVYKLGGEYVVIVNDEGMPRLRVSNFYKKILREDKMDNNNNTKKYVEDKMRSAMWLIKSIHQRQMTLYKVTESIVKFQRNFLDEGIHKLRPLTLRDVADDIAVHESTVSRITTNKYVQTPRGIFELKYFFHSGLEQSDGRSVSSVRIKEMIKRLVEKEDKQHPLTDAQILKILLAKNINVARRTITKYRESLTILPASQRKQY